MITPTISATTSTATTVKPIKVKCPPFDRFVGQVKDIPQFPQNLTPKTTGLPHLGHGYDRCT
jgi:hypothetical protein